MDFHDTNPFLDYRSSERLKIHEYTTSKKRDSIPKLSITIHKPPPRIKVIVVMDNQNRAKIIYAQMKSAHSIPLQLQVNIKSRNNQKYNNEVVREGKRGERRDRGGYGRERNGGRGNNQNANALQDYV